MTCDLEDFASPDPTLLVSLSAYRKLNLEELLHV